MTDKLKWLENAINILRNNSADKWQSLTMDTNLGDLGLDSLDIVEIQLMYEEDFKCEIPDSPIPLVTVGDILKLLK